MAYVSGGRVSFVDKGAYSATTQYNRLDYVKYMDCIFVAKRTTIGNAPDPSIDTADWTKFISLTAPNYIYDEAGNLAVPEPGLQFMNGSVVDNPTNNRTEITIGITETEWSTIQNILNL